jgi:predicted 3-demethylubiquinone-9 3-methyltransferase (glyoxalase superfamily)
MMSNPDKSKAVVQAFLKMRKFDIAELEKAYAGG